uniref:hypothetical protein n=1 Tax=Legionella sainthelensi TaxID=28087 RepID=UPI001C6FCB1D
QVVKNQADAGRPEAPQAYLSPVFVPFGDSEVPEGFSKTGDTLEFLHKRYFSPINKLCYVIHSSY